MNGCRDKTGTMIDPATEFFNMKDQLLFDKTATTSRSSTSTSNTSSRKSPTTFREQMMNRKRHMMQVPVRYEVTDTVQEIKIAFDVPVMNANDIEIGIENDGNMLTIRGSRESKSNGYTFTSKFSKHFDVEHSFIDTDQISAQLDNGILIVSAPKHEKPFQEEMTKKIPITVTSSLMEESLDVDTNENNDNKSESKMNIEVKNNDNTKEIQNNTDWRIFHNIDRKKSLLFSVATGSHE
jgi:HSP20 family molecular chaperone IbpA